MTGTDPTSEASPWPARWLACRTARVVSTAACCAIVGWSVYSTIRLHDSPGEPTRRFRDFYEFFAGAEALVRGNDIFAAGDLGYIYPPLLATLLMPLVHLGMPAAATAWVLLNGLLLGASAWLGSRVVAARLGLSKNLAPVIALIALAILSDKIISDMRMQQTNMLMLACWSVGLWAIGSHPLRGGLGLSLAANIKYITAITLPYFLIRGRWKDAAAFLGGFLFWAVLPAVFIGWDRNLSIWQGAVGGLVSSSAPGTPIAGEARVMSTRDFGVSVSTAMVRAADAMGKPQLAPVLSAAALAAVFVAAWILYHRSGQPMWRGRFGAAERSRPRLVLVEFIGLIVVALAFSPQTNTRHFVQALPLGMLLAAPLVSASQTRTRLLALAGITIWWLRLILPPAGTAPALIRAWHNSGGICLSMVVGWLFALGAVLREEGTTPGKSNPASSQAAPTPQTASP